MAAVEECMTRYGVSPSKLEKRSQNVSDIRKELMKQLRKVFSFMLGNSSTQNMSTDGINRSWEEEGLG